MRKYFTEQLLVWHRTENDRPLPWKNESDPYKIWLSEVLLQQTRAQQVLPYYERFISEYPTINDLANAEDGIVFKLWEGLGYYNRCRNMLATARYIAFEKIGVFPHQYEEILKLKGVGSYTAAAIASFAFSLPYAVVDGNVNRVLSRYFGIDTPYDTTEGKTLFANLAQELLPVAHNREYNQAIMDLGATICTYKTPICIACPLREHCFAYEKELINILPVKSKKLTITTRYFHYILLRWCDKIWVQKRTASDIWQNLYEFFLIEADLALSMEELRNNEQFISAGLSGNTIITIGNYKQRLTHRIIETRFYTIALDKEDNAIVENGEWVAVDKMKDIPFPKTINSFLNDYPISFQ